MVYHLIITEGAELDMLEAYGYYEDQESGLGERFLAAVQSRFAQIVEHPGYYSFIDDRNILRDVAIDPFPYVVIYEVEGEAILVYVVHQTYKKPYGK